MYFPLHAQEIRLVDILPGQWDDDIRCEVRQAAMANRPRYKALSYVWGASRGSRRSITLNDVPHSVTPNLDFALRRIRRANQRETFWIDALCINQTDEAERGTQVGMMKEIYARAGAVVVYLGEAPQHVFMRSARKKPTASVPTSFYGNEQDKDNIERFKKHWRYDGAELPSGRKLKLNFVHELCCLVSLLAQSTETSKMPLEDADQDSDAPFKRNLFEALRYLMRSGWWQRVWVIQEIVVPEQVILMYDSVSAPWEMFANAALSYMQSLALGGTARLASEYSDVMALFSQSILDIETMRCRWKTVEETTLLTLLRQFGNRKASDDRDKVYALLGLIRNHLPRNQSHILPDYSQDPRSVFRNTTVHIMSSTGSLSVLTGDTGRKNRQDLPSWVADWSAYHDDMEQQRTEDVELYNVTYGIKIYVEPFGAPHLDGITRHVASIAAESEGKSTAAQLHLHPWERLSSVVGSDDWKAFGTLDSGADWSSVSDSDCLEALASYFAANDGPEFLRDHGDFLEAPASFVDDVIDIGIVHDGAEDLQFVIQVWGTIFERSLSHHQEIGSKDADQVFLRTICADVVYVNVPAGLATKRRATTEDLGVIAAWILGSHPSSATQTFMSSLAHLTHPVSRDDLTSCNLDVLATLQAATWRRKLFVGRSGLLGLGPADTQSGDVIYHLKGGKIPFILRDAHQIRVPVFAGKPVLGRVQRSSLRLIGSCYADQLMDGETSTALGAGPKYVPPRALPKNEMQDCLSFLDKFETSQDDLLKVHGVFQAVKSQRFKEWMCGSRQVSTLAGATLDLGAGSHATRSGLVIALSASEITSRETTDRSVVWNDASKIEDIIASIKIKADKAQQQCVDAKSQLDDARHALQKKMPETILCGLIFLV